MIPAPAGILELSDGRRLAYDDIGNPNGVPLVYLHGCPGSRLSRHPDDSLAAEAGVRLVAVDRAGYGRSDADPQSNEASHADDVVALADKLDVDSFAVLGWSSGGPTALALGSRHPSRVRVVGVAAGQPPLIADVAGETPEAFAEMAAPYVAQPGITVDLAMEAAIEGWDAGSLADLAAIPGLHAQLALTLAAAVEHGLAGVESDLRAMARPWPFTLELLSVPVILWYGTDDLVYGPDVGRSLADRIPDARLQIIEGASHLLPLVHWSTLLQELALVTKETSCR